MTELTLYCNECHRNKRMVEVKIPVASRVVRAIGLIILIVSTIGIGVSAIFVFHSVVEAININENPLAFIIERFDVLYSVLFGAISMLGMLIGLLLLKKIKAYQCIQCGHIEHGTPNKSIYPNVA